MGSAWKVNPLWAWAGVACKAFFVIGVAMQWVLSRFHFAVQFAAGDFGITVMIESGIPGDLDRRLSASGVAPANAEIHHRPAVRARAGVGDLGPGLQHCLAAGR